MWFTEGFTPRQVQITWLEMKSSVKWNLQSHYKPSLFSLMVNHSSIHFYTHFNNEAGKILRSANEETAIKEVRLCKHLCVHHLAEQMQGSLMSLHWLIKDTRGPPTPSAQCALYVSSGAVNYDAILLSFISHTFITSQGLSWHLNSFQFHLILDCWSSASQKYHMPNADTLTLIDMCNNDLKICNSYCTQSDSGGVNGWVRAAKIAHQSTDSL